MRATAATPATPATPAIRTRLHRGLATGAILVAALLGSVGCSSGRSATSDDSGSSASGDVAADVGAAGSAGGAASSARQPAADSHEAVADTAPQQAAVISTGDVALRSRDVGRVVDGVRRTVAGDGGSVQKEATDTDHEGRPTSSRLTVRVPSAQFAAAMHDLGGLGTLVSTSSDTKDVTTVVLDNQVRVRVAQRSIDRITALLDQATSIKEVIAIETELAQRQADLASLESQQKYLADQTSMATIEVAVDQTSAAPPTDTGHTGFAAGLAAGWHALGRTGTAAATALGALLPWAVVLVVIGGPIGLVLRHRRRPRLPA